MISTAFILVGALILNIITMLLSGFSFIVPSQIQDALTWLFSSVHFLNGIFPVSDLLLAGIVLLSVWGGIYLIRIFLWLISFIPGVGHHELPSIHAGQDTVNYADIQRQLRRRK